MHGDWPVEDRLRPISRQTGLIHTLTGAGSGS